MNTIKNEELDINQINNKELRENLLDNAFAYLVNTNMIKKEDFAGMKARFGYLLMVENHGIEALFKIMRDDKTFYFACQGDNLKILNINEEQFESVSLHMLDLYKIKREDKTFILN